MTQVSGRKRIEIARTINVAPMTSEEVAAAWCDMDSDQQAEFFEHVARFTSEWPGGGLETQMWHVARSGFLTDKGRRVMADIGAYSQETTT